MRAVAPIIAALLVAACAPGAAPSPTPPDAERVAFVLANPFGLVGLDREGRVLGPIADLHRDSAPAAPVAFPDGRRLAFGLSLPPQLAAQGFGSGIWTVGLDGSDLRALVEHEAENVFYASPQIDPTGRYLYAHRRAAIIRDGVYVGNEDSIERIDLETLERRTVVRDGADIALSPDGTTLVYVHVVDGQPQGLRRVSVDGTDERPFFSFPEPWWYLQAPRYSPDGRWIVFSGANGVVPQEALPRSGRLGHLGIPSDLVVAPADGSSARTLLETAEDVVPAWSPDGTHVAYILLGGLCVVDVATGESRELRRHESFIYGDLLWVRR